MKKLLAAYLLLVSTCVCAETPLINPVRDLIANSMLGVSHYERITIETGAMKNSPATLYVDRTPVPIKSMPTYAKGQEWTGGYRISIIGKEITESRANYFLLVSPSVPANVNDELFVLKVSVKSNGEFESDYTGTYLGQGTFPDINKTAEHMLVFKGFWGGYAVRARMCDSCELIKRDL